jgi:hypothetical protein
MKPLKRPMFRSGGPIKEGIMDGMKQPQQLVQPNEDGSRPGYAGPLAAIPLIFQGLRAARTLAPIAKNASFFQRINPMRLMTSGRFRNVTEPVVNRGKSGQVLSEGTKITKKGIFESLKDPKQLGMAIRENPFTALSSLTLPNMAISAAPSIYSGLKSAGKTYIDAVLPGKQFQDDKDQKTTETDTTGLKKVDSFDEVKKGGESVSQEKKEQLTADRIEENRKRYYKLMGIDKMKKGAAYDSLIDASKIIQQEGGDLKGAIKSGNLQSQIINAISKNLDKSTDLKKQIDAAILKGEIEKDIKSADTMDKRLKEAQIKRLERDEKQNTTAAKIAAVQIEKGAVTAADTAAILRSDGVEYTGALPDDEFLKFKKKNKGKDERDFLIENYGALDDGRYIVGGRLVEKRGDNVAFAI